MTRPWLWNKICIWFCSMLLLLYIFSNSADCRIYKCSTADGRQGVCVAKRYCREVSSAPLRRCDGDDTFCCPIPASPRSAPNPPRVTLAPPARVYEERLKEQVDDPRTPARDRNQSPGAHEGSENEPRRIRPSIHFDEDKKRRFRPDEGRTRESLPLDDPPWSETPSTLHNEPERPLDNERKEAKYGDEGSWQYTPRRNESRPKSGKWPTRPMRVDAPIKFPEAYETSVPHPKVPACGVRPYELFIAGGEESRDHEWPWMTAIFRRHQGSKPKTFLCGGSLINTRYVLTAAHCFVNNYVILPASSFVVRLGSHYLDSGEEYTVSQLVVHANHSGSDFFNDIALVRMASEVYVTDKIAPVCLPFLEMLKDDQQQLVGRMATVAGWGDTAFRTSGTRILQHVVVPVVSSEECFAAYSRVRGAAFLARGSDHVVCAGLREGGKDACLGDSGGPLMIKTTEDRWVVVGIVSLGYKCAEPGYPGVYTRVTHYMAWIQSKMKHH